MNIHLKTWTRDKSDVTMTRQQLTCKLFRNACRFGLLCWLFFAGSLRKVHCFFTQIPGTILYASLKKSKTNAAHLLCWLSGLLLPSEWYYSSSISNTVACNICLLHYSKAPKDLNTMCMSGWYLLVYCEFLL